jgi:hypothetical protein
MRMNLMAAHAQPLAPANPLDSVIPIVDEQGEPYQARTNPGDDHTQMPGSADPTPEAFDDIWVNHDIHPGVDSNAAWRFWYPEALSLT